MAKEEYDDVELSGFRAWLYRVWMFITWPFRKLWKILLVLLAVVAVAIIVPMCYGVKFHDICAWYKTKLSFTEMKNKAPEAQPAPSSAENEEKKVSTKRYAVWNVGEFNQGAYDPIKHVQPQQPENKAAAQKVSDQAAAPVTAEKKVEYHPLVKKKKKPAPETVAEPVQKPIERNLRAYYNVVENSDLEYLKTPQVYQGTATVVGSNSLYIADKFVYLYGIYSDPQIHDLVQAQEYLVNLTENKEVDCHVVAYTVQTQTATALCFAGDTLLNKALVQRYLADNVGLR
ncbi:MAG: hypothetical protein J6Y91_05405 [Alphaproteobacteria bacterium]|nr:hypothetical protein [Alphaproteobacteria bacterium]